MSPVWNNHTLLLLMFGGGYQHFSFTNNTLSRVVLQTALPQIHL